MKTKSAKSSYLDNNTGIDWEGQSWTEREFSHPENTVRIGTAFSGIGSPEMALQQLGVKHQIMFACDIDKYAKKSYMANYPIKEEDWCDDIYNLDAKKYRGMIDLFVGGVCCQSWSLAGAQKGLKDPRGILFYQFVRVICECAPKVWIFENVANIIHHKDPETGVRSWPILMNDMETEFKKAGLHYHIHYRVLDSSNYGNPQQRKRVFCIGILDESGVETKSDFLFPAPIKLEKSTKDFLDDLTPGVRKLTARERISLMGFPKTFKQVVCNTQFSKQAGNSIVVDVMKALYKQLDITKYGVKEFV